MRSRLAVLTSLALVLAVAGAARSETKVEVKKVHLCCPACVSAVGGILKKVDGVTDPKCDREGKTVTFTAKDDETAKKAVQALADGAKRSEPPSFLERAKARWGERHGGSDW